MLFCPILPFSQAHSLPSFLWHGFCHSTVPVSVSLPTWINMPKNAAIRMAKVSIESDKPVTKYQAIVKQNKPCHSIHFIAASFKKEMSCNRTKLKCKIKTRQMGILLHDGKSAAQKPISCRGMHSRLLRRHVLTMSRPSST